MQRFGIASPLQLNNAAITGSLDPLTSPGGVRFQPEKAPESSSLAYFQRTGTAQLSDEDLRKLNRFIALTDEDDDVQEVFHNVRMPIEDEE